MSGARNCTLQLLEDVKRGRRRAPPSHDRPCRPHAFLSSDIPTSKLDYYSSITTHTSTNPPPVTTRYQRATALLLLTQNRLIQRSLNDNNKMMGEFNSAFNLFCFLLLPLKRYAHPIARRCIILILRGLWPASSYGHGSARRLRFLWSQLNVECCSCSCVK